MHIHSLMAFVAYFTILFFIAIAAVLSTRKKDKEDSSGFMLGGRSVNFWLTAISAHASDMSNWLFMVFPAAVFSQGVPAVWIAIGLVTYMFLNWHFVAPKLRIETEKYKSTTLSSYFEKRFSDSSGNIRIISAVVTLIFFTIYMAAGFKGIGLIFKSVFNFSDVWGILLAVFVVIAYTSIGGFIAVAWTDFFQGMFLLAMIILVPCVAFTHTGGFAAIKLAALNKGVSFALLPDYSLATITKSIFTAFGWGLGYFGMLHILTKFMGIKDPSEIKKSKYLGMTWQILSLSSAAFVGLVGMAFFKNGLADPATIFIDMVNSLFSPFFAGFILCAIFAATISTIDSQVLVLASTVTEDFYKSLFRKKAKEKELLWVYRIGITVVCVVAALIALDKSYSMGGLVYYAWRGIGSSFSPLVLLALYSKRVNKYGALSGMIIGCFIALTWKPFLSTLILPYQVDAMIPGFFISLASAWGVSYFSNK